MPVGERTSCCVLSILVAVVGTIPVIATRPVSLPQRPAISRAADQILAHQTRDGAIVMAPVGATMRVVPYFADLAALGLLAAYRETHQPRYLEAAQRWIAWYAAHQGPDGTIQDHTGSAGAWTATGHYDSTDSYAGTYLEAVLTLYRTHPEPDGLRAHYPSVLQAVAAIRSTLQPNGLTTARPDYPVMYTMDAVETLRGLRAACEIARLSGDTAHVAEFRALADRMEQGIARDLWNEQAGCYRIGVQTDGGRMEGLAQWYPDIMANLLAVAWLPDSGRDRALYARLKRQFVRDLPARVGSEDDLERLVWWGFAARTAGDAALFHRILAALSDFDETVHSFDNPALLGSVCRLLAHKDSFP